MFDWFELFNLTEFEETELVSKTLTVNLEGYGNAEILITKGNVTSIVYDDVMLPINFDDQNPYQFEGYAVYLDEEDYVWLGIETEDE